MSHKRLQRLLRAAEDARRMIAIHRQFLIDSYTDERTIESVGDGQVAVDVKEMDLVLKHLRRAIERYEPITYCKQCSASHGQHYGNCPAATPSTMIKGPGE